MQAYRWIEDSRDEFTKERLEALDDAFKVRPRSVASLRWAGLGVNGVVGLDGAVCV